MSDGPLSGIRVVEMGGIGAGLDPADQYRTELWPQARAVLAAVFASRPRDEWAALFEGTDACVTPVLTIAEAAGHPHIAYRQSLVHRDGMIQSGPAPRISGTDRGAPPGPPSPGEHTSIILRRWTERTRRQRAPSSLNSASGMSADR